MSANGRRWGCSSPRRRPALELACTPARRKFGCPASSRHTSPPAYPVAPVTPTVHVCPVLTMHDHTRPCMTVHDGTRAGRRGGRTVPARWRRRGISGSAVTTTVTPRTSTNWIRHSAATTLPTRVLVGALRGGGLTARHLAGHHRQS